MSNVNNRNLKDLVDDFNQIMRNHYAEYQNDNVMIEIERFTRKFYSKDPEWFYTDMFYYVLDRALDKNCSNLYDELSYWLFKIYGGVEL